MEKKTCTKWLRAVLLTLVMTVLLGAAALAASVQTVDMKANSSGGFSYVGTWGNKNTTVYHRITVKKTGLLGITGYGMTTKGSRHGMRVSLCDSKKKSLERASNGSYAYQPSKGSATLAFYGVKKGTYYIKVSGEPYYALGAAFKAVSDKGGASKSKAKKIAKGKVITGVMPAGEKASRADWVKFKVTQKKILTFSLEAAGNGKFNFYLTGPGYKNYKVDSFMNDGGSYYSMNRYGNAIAVSKGTYYLKIARASGSNKKSSGIWSFKWNLR